MPLDPSIILGGRQVAIPSFQEAQTAALDLQGKQLELGEKVRSLKNQAAVRSILARYGGDLEKARPELYQVDPELGLKVDASLLAQKTHALDFQKAQSEFHAHQVESLGRLAETVDDDLSLQSFRQSAKAMGIPEADQIPPVWNEHTKLVLQGIRQSAIPVVEQEREKARAAEQARKDLDEQRRIAADAAKAQKDEAAAKLTREDKEADNARDRERLRLEQERVNLEGKRVGIESKREGRLAAGDKLVKVEHKDPATGKTVIEWLPESERRGKVFEKGTNATTENRLASATAVNQTGEDIIQKLSDPAYASKVGPAMGRYSSVRDFIGNPPPEFAELAGAIESYSLANMGVHGMRSAQGAEQIKKLLDQKHTPESLIATIRGLNKFSEHFMQNEGRAPSATTTTPPPATGTGLSYQDYLRSKAQAK